MYDLIRDALEELVKASVPVQPWPDADADPVLWQAFCAALREAQATLAGVAPCHFQQDLSGPWAPTCKAPKPERREDGPESMTNTWAAVTCIDCLRVELQRLKLLVAGVVPPAPAMHLPAQMGELRAQVELAIAALTPADGRVSKAAALSHLERARKLCPIEHDDQQGGKPRCQERTGISNQLQCVLAAGHEGEHELSSGTRFTFIPNVRRRLWCEEHRLNFSGEGPWPAPQWDQPGIFVRAECPSGHWIAAEVGPLLGNCTCPEKGCPLHPLEPFKEPV